MRTNEQPQTARELAKWLIEPYVRRGDSIESLREGGMGHCGSAGMCEIHLDHILIQRVGDIDHSKSIDERLCEELRVIARFRLRDIYRAVAAELRTQTTQPALWQESEVSA